MRRLFGCAIVLLLVSFSPLPAQEVRTADAALQRLKEGNARFVTDKPAEKDVSAKRRAEVAKGQHPFAIVLTCADSRLSPELIFDLGLGDAFVLRNAGNISDIDVLGSIEYATEHLKVPLVVVLGHQGCGAVNAVLGKEHATGNLKELLQHVHVPEKLPEDKEEALRAAIKANTLHQAGRLTKQSKELAELASSGRLKIVAGVYSLRTGEIDWLDMPNDKKTKP